MTRPLKFRAWDKREKRWWAGDAMYISALDGPPAQYGFTESVTEHLTVEQFTGLTDKNGKEIYEGDLVVDYAGRMEKGQEDWVWTVIFENGMTNAVVETQGKRVSTITPNGILHSESLEVVGNIHENPNLLGGKYS